MNHKSVLLGLIKVKKEVDDTRKKYLFTNLRIIYEILNYEKKNFQVQDY